MKWLWKITIIIASAILILIATTKTITNNGNRDAVYTHIDATNNEIADMRPNDNIDDTDAFVKLMNYARMHSTSKLPITIKFPQGRFLIGNHQNYLPIYLPSYTTIQMESNTRIDLTTNVSFLGVSKSSNDGGINNFAWQGGQFVGDGSNYSARFTLFHGHDMKFANMRFKTAILYNNHAFDINGSEKILLDHNQFLGYGNGSNFDRKSESHIATSEAIQLDYGRLNSSFGQHDQAMMIRLVPNFVSLAQQLNFPADITISNSTFGKARLANGRYTIGQNPLGAHAYTSNMGRSATNISFINNTVSDSIAQRIWVKVNGQTQLNHYSGVLHFLPVNHLIIANNVFRSDAVPGSWISLYSRQAFKNTSNVAIMGNRFETKSKRAPVLAMTDTDITAGGSMSAINVTNNIVSYVASPDQITSNQAQMATLLIWQRGKQRGLPNLSVQNNHHR